jgi:hypothetical protein
MESAQFIELITQLCNGAVGRQLHARGLRVVPGVAATKPVWGFEASIPCDGEFVDWPAAEAALGAGLDGIANLVKLWALDELSGYESSVTLGNGKARFEVSIHATLPEVAPDTPEFRAAAAEAVK